MKTKILTSDDWQIFRDIRLAGLTSDPQAFGASLEKETQRTEPEWKKRLDGSDRFYMVVEEDNKICSLAGAIKGDDGLWTLVSVYTVPEARGKGYAQMIVKGVLDEVKKRDGKRVQLTVNTDQVDAVHAYEKSGFATIQHIDDELLGDGKYHKAYLMEKSLV